MHGVTCVACLVHVCRFVFVSMFLNLEFQWILFHLHYHLLNILSQDILDMQICFLS
jgi:hypothetical protein